MTAKIKLTKDQKAEAATAEVLGEKMDLSLEPQLLTDKAKTKVRGCRVCGRPCIVSYFMATPKVACLEHKERRANITAVHGIDPSKEPHILTDKAETKTVPCRTCGRPCVVTRFASAAKVACNDCREKAPRPKTTVKHQTNSNGERTTERTTHIATTYDLEWTDWTVLKPFHFEPLYIGEEKAEHLAAKADSLDYGKKARAAKVERQNAERDLSMRPSKFSTEKKQEENAEICAKLDAIVVAKEGEEAAHLIVAEAAADKSIRLARIAYLRGAVDAGYKIEEANGHKVLTGREVKAVIPKDYLDKDGYHQLDAVPVAA